MWQNNKQIHKVEIKIIIQDDANEHQKKKDHYVHTQQEVTIINLK